jgi:signal transduction histidine kinase
MLHLDSSTLLALAPREVAPLRALRYRGEGFTVPLGDFRPEDAAVLQQLYTAVNGCYRTWLRLGQPEPLGHPEMMTALTGLAAPALRQAIGRLGSTSYAGHPHELAVRKTLHDVRGGALTALLGFAHLLVVLPAEAQRARAVLYYARDHAKIMRHAIPDLDPAARLADEQERAHDVAGLVAPLQQGDWRLEERRVALELQIEYEGNLTSCCQEVAAVDRVLYNFLNNAMRFTADDRVGLAILPLGGAVRLVVANRLTPGQIAWTTEKTGGDFGRLFLGGITHGGQGIGLSTCADIVGAAFGVPERAEVVRRQLIGARLVEQTWCAWFHWPTW